MQAEERDIDTDIVLEYGLTSSLSIDCEDNTAYPVNSESQRASSVITSYLMERVDVFRELSELRKKGWSSSTGDKYFEQQRRIADTCNTRTAKYFYQLMQKIGQELQLSTGAFSIPDQGYMQNAILDLCAAPGGFLKMALMSNPGCRALGFSLPISNGGHKVLLPRNPNVTLKFLDITMLAVDIGVTNIPDGHPDSGNFLSAQFNPWDMFDVVLCDGQVLRTHVRPSYRERREARRLTVSQLVLGLEHIRPGGTMIALLHRVEVWDTVCLLYKFSRFSSIKLFKPTVGHAKRSSFYMVARDVKSMHSEAILAIKGWRKTWEVATFGTDDEYRKHLDESDLMVEEILDHFGAELVRLGRSIWQVQAKALAQASFIKNE